MPEAHVLLATAAEWPELGDDERLVLPGLAARGVAAAPAVWSDPAVDWSGAVVVVRSTWDYVGRLDEFLGWVDSTAQTATVLNSPRVLREYTDKRYLRALAASGVPVVETEWIERGTTGNVAAVLRDRGWPVAVVKPSVSNGARDTMLVTAASAESAQSLADEIARTRDVMIQPYLHSVEGYGERSLLYLGGVFSHAVRKAPMLAGALSPDDVEPVEATADELALAQRALRWVGEDLLYARVDLARLDDGTPVVMELELAEPRLYLRYADAADRFADVIASMVRTLGRPAGT